MLYAQDIMTCEVIVVREDTSLQDFARQLQQHRVSAMPVVDGEGHLVGIISATDLVERDQPLHLPTVVSLFDWVLYLESEKKFAEQVRRLTAETVGELCQRQVISCGPLTPVSEVAALMTRNRIHLVPVVEEGRLLGVVARFDIIRTLE
ncbi:CBS domain-containing protein [Desulfuromonas thiophila]|uniref:CBS domain-containing protein n=1 Tax=Desulfuromonas thiophila TaxID=57664 RepID=UPI0029F526BA|nr:CBS domain-containing protein [Desulfuromonas thiophila]